jgi:septal ring factor EnvC (AmiA/AmiB activator)
MMTLSLSPLRVRPSAFLSAVAAVLLSSSQTGWAQAPAPASPSSSGSPVIQAEGPPKNVQSRPGPKRRKGKEGSEEAQIDADQARELYMRRKLRLQQIQAERAEIAREQRTLATNRARMHARLIETARAIKLSEKRLTEIEERLGVTRAKVKEQREKLEDKSAQMSALFVLMQSMSRQPPPVMITHSKDALRMIRSGMVLAAFYADVEKLASDLSVEVDRLDSAQKEAELQEQRRKAEQAQNSRLKTQIDLLLLENSEQMEAATENLETLKGAAEINVANLKSLEEMLPVLDAAAAKRGKPAPRPAEAENAAKLASLQPGRMEPSIRFANSQGLLPFPVQGRTLLKFGQIDRDGTASKGMHIETRNGAQVVSPCDGSILYAGPFRSYGQLLIIDPGGGYHVVLAGIDRIQVVQNQAVLAGEPIAAMASEPRSGEKSSARPILYVEFRRDQQSIDPAPWWSAGGKG